MNDRVRQIFELAIEQPTCERDRFLAAECATDGELLNRVRALLECDRLADSESFWQSIPASIVLAESAVAADPWIGRTVGPWRIDGVIGSGGMGTVYRATRADAEYHQVAAIKLVNSGLGAAASLRFRTERQILAHLQHANIARLLDGGTTSEGVPYLVMEFIEGEPVTAFCTQRTLTVPDRLQLFRQICSAVHFAHQRLVIHRDLKPGNILVTESGQPKLLDFGIAKLLSDDSDPAATLPTVGMQLLTPRYASPEQVRGEAITTASDVYSLGVILYELLTGVLPYARAATHIDSLRAICEQEPEKPSRAVTREKPRAADTKYQLSRTLRGDLDNIVLKALEKDPQRRYTSVEQLSDDVERYLNGLPVRAHRDTALYRLRKFVRRNAFAASAGAFVAISLMAGLAGTAWQAHRANVERARAERRFNDVRKLADSLLFEFGDSIENVPGTLAARQLVAKRGMEYLDSLSPEAGDNRKFKAELAAAYNKIGRLTFNTRVSLDAHRKAVAIMASLTAAEPANRAYKHELANSYALLANLLSETGQSLAAVENSIKSLHTLESLVKQAPGNSSYQLELVDTYDTTAQFLSTVARDREALALVQKGAALNQMLLAREPQNADRQRGVMLNKEFLAAVLLSVGEYRGAVSVSEDALHMCDAELARDAANTIYRRDMWICHYRLASATAASGDPTRALTEYRTALSYIKALSNADPGDRGHARGLSVTYFTIANTLADMKRYTDAVPLYNRALEISTQLLKADPNKIETRFDVANIKAHLGKALLESEGRQMATAVIREACALFERIAAEDPANAKISKARAEASPACETR